MADIERKAELCPDQGGTQDIRTLATANKGRLIRCDFSRIEIERALSLTLAKMVEVDLRAEGTSYTTEFRIGLGSNGPTVLQATVCLTRPASNVGGVDG